MASRGIPHRIPHAMSFAPLLGDHALEMHLAALDTQGYTLIPAAIEQPLLGQLQAHFDAVVTHPERYPSAKDGGREADNGPGIVEWYRAYEIEEACKAIMDLPGVFGIAKEAYRRRGGDIRLLSGPVCQHVPAQVGSSMHWHSDGPLRERPAQWHSETGSAQSNGDVDEADADYGGRMGGYLRLTCFISDVGPDGGGTAIVPGTHHWRGAGPPAYVNTEEGPAAIPGTVFLQGKAGDCVLNWTKLWHTRSPNLSAHSRRIFWQVYKRSDQPHWAGDDINLTKSFIEAEPDEGRRLLMGTRGWEAEWLEVDPDRPSAQPPPAATAKI